MKKLFFHLSAALCLLTACNDAPLVHEEAQAPPAATAPNAHAISMEQALANLDAFLTVGNASRSNHRTVVNVKTVKYAATRSRAEADAVDCDNLLYVANFADNQGYAILAADDRIPEPVLAVTELGSLSDSLRVPGLGFDLDGIVFPDYPTTGPGLFTEPERDNEVLLNPNTIDLHTALADTLVGHYNEDHYGAINMDGSTDNDELLLNGITQVFDMCVIYAVNRVKKFKDQGEDGPDVGCVTPVPGGSNPSIPNPTQENLKWNDDYPGGNNAQNPDRTDYYFTDWYIDKTVEPLLNTYKAWYDRDDYNQFYPEKRALWIIGKKRKAPAGSAVIALGKIIAYHKRPASMYYNNVMIDWSAINAATYNSNSTKNVAMLLRNIAILTNSNCVYQGTYTGVNNMNTFLTSCGYQNVNRYVYDFDKVINMLNQSKPVILMGEGKNVTSNYCWNVDGYRLYKRKIMKIKYIRNMPVDTTYAYEPRNMLHCTFGRGGYGDGYYVDNIFRLDLQSNIYDSPNHTPESTHFNKNLRIILYNK